MTLVLSKFIHGIAELAPQNKSLRVKVCKKIASWLDGAFSRAFSEIILLIAVPAFVTEMFNSSQLSGNIASLLFIDQKSAQVIKDSQLVVFIGFWVWIFLIRWMMNFVKDVAAQGDALSPTHLIALHNLIDGPVEGKCERFSKMSGEIYRSIKAGLPLPQKGEAFQQITKPEDQIFLISKAILESFKLITNQNSKLKLRIAAFKNGKPDSWFTWHPYGGQPGTDISELNDSALTLCAKRKCLILIEDIKAELKLGTQSRFKATQTGDNASGSLVCYAISHPPSNDVPYVISVHSNRKNEFLESQREVYEWIFEKFAMRLALEHSLRYVKENTV